jgi:hypothetical protein
VPLQAPCSSLNPAFAHPVAAAACPPAVCSPAATTADAAPDAPDALPPTDTGDGPVRHWQGRPQAAPNRVLVRFKQTPAAARVSMAQAERPLPGLQLRRLVGKRHTTRVPGAAGGGAAAARTSSSSSSSSSTSLPPDAVMLFSITDGSSVEEKVAQLRANPGGGWFPGSLLLPCLPSPAGPALPVCPACPPLSMPSRPPHPPGFSPQYTS